MPRAGQTDPDSLQTRAEAWLHANPGEHDVSAIADGLGLAPDDERRTHKVAIACRELWTHGRAVKARRGVYAAPETVGAPA